MNLIIAGLFYPIRFAERDVKLHRQNEWRAGGFIYRMITLGGLEWDECGL